MPFLLSRARNSHLHLRPRPRFLGRGLGVPGAFSSKPRLTEAVWLYGSGCIQLDAVVRKVVPNAFIGGSFNKLAQLGQRLLFARRLEAHSVAAFTVDHRPATEPELFFRSRLTLDVASAAALEADTTLNVGERPNMTFTVRAARAFNLHDLPLTSRACRDAASELTLRYVAAQPCNPTGVRPGRP